MTDELQLLTNKLKSASLPPDLLAKTELELTRLAKMQNTKLYLQLYDSLTRYLDWLVSLPWHKTTSDNLDLHRAAQILDTTHYGMQEPKDRILEYLASLKLLSSQSTTPKTPAILLVGLVGTGKTTFAYSVAKALNRHFARIPFGGLGDAQDLRGLSRLASPTAEPGQIIKAYRQTQSLNPVILLDEIDRVSQQHRSDIMGVLVEILDPSQNSRFLDYYLDYPFDLSQTLFIATSNNTKNIATAVLDRFEIIQMPSYTDQEKIHIAKEYLLPRILKRNGLQPSQLLFQDEVWPLIVRPLGFDAGVRSLEKALERIARRTARLIVEGRGDKLVINKDNYKQYLSTY